MGRFDDTAAAADQDDALKVTQQEGFFSNNLAMGLGMERTGPVLNNQIITRTRGGNMAAAMTSGQLSTLGPVAVITNASTTATPPCTYSRIDPTRRG